MKSLQFRSIAPKAPAAVVTPSPSPAAVLSRQPPSALLPCEATTPAAAAASSSSPKSIIVPAGQNYALMQIAGQEGTFSLVALPPPSTAAAVSSSQPQQPQQQAQTMQNNLKLPIPRYQPARSKGAAEKVKPAPKTPVKVAAATPLAVRSVATSPMARKRMLETAETKETKVEPSEQLIMIDPTSSSSSSEIAVAAFLPDNAKNSPEEGGAAKIRRRLCQAKPAAAAAAQPPPGTAAASITVLSPSIFSKAVQIIPSPPKGKLPILPYSKMKSALVVPASAKLAAAANAVASSPEKKGGGVPTAIITAAKSSSDPSAKTQENTAAAEASSHNQVPKAQTTTALPVSVLGAPLAQKAPGKKRGRKRKTMEDILAFEARKKRSLSFFRRRVPEKVPPLSASAAAIAAASPLGSKQKEVEDISKKYRSIRPKPVLVMETTAVPRLISLPAGAAAIAPEAASMAPTSSADATLKPAPTAAATLHLRGGGVASSSSQSHPRASSTTFLGSGGSGRPPLHRCPVCGRCFQFKHHLQGHMNSHTNSRPYVCPVCRKAYAHSGSLSTHMKLHHGAAADGRPRGRSTLRCAFCEKAFGYVGVYFAHLREVHRVVLTVEPSISQHEEDDDPPAEGSISPETSDGQCQEEEREDPVELQIKCGRCQAIAPTFADMKLHLLYAHGEEVQARTGAATAAVRDGREAEDELVKHAAHYWRQLNEKRETRNILAARAAYDEGEEEEEDKGGAYWRRGGRRLRSGAGAAGVLLAAGSAFNCVLCSQVLDSREGVMEHWRSRHHCEQTGVLWDALSSYSAKGEAGTGTEGEDMDTDTPSPH